MKHLLISRTDSIGDVVLTLPMAGLIKERSPEVKVSFLGSAYTRPVVEHCAHVDTFYDWNEIESCPPPDVDTILHVLPRKEISRWAKRQGIATRIGTSHRPYHWTTCNRLVNLGRKKSDLHEAQLNLQLLRPLIKRPFVALADLPEYYGWRTSTEHQAKFAPYLSDQHFNLIIHPKSQGSAVEWPLYHYLQLVRLLPTDQFRILVTGTAAEGKVIEQECSELLRLKHVTNAIGAFSLPEFIDFIGQADGLLACSTGPLHLAAASGIRTLGLYSTHRPIHAGRWGPVGNLATYVEAPDGSMPSANLAGITPEQIHQKLAYWLDSIPKQ